METNSLREAAKEIKKLKAENISISANNNALREGCKKVEEDREKILQTVSELQAEVKQTTADWRQDRDQLAADYNTANKRIKELEKLSEFYKKENDKLRAALEFVSNIGGNLPDSEFRKGISN